MQYETDFGGLRKHSTYDELVSYIKRDPDKIKYPNIKALLLHNHPIYSQIRDSLRSFDDDQQHFQAYLHSDDPAPYDAPRPRPPPDQPGTPDDQMDNGPGDDPLTRPPGIPPNRHVDLLTPGPDNLQQALGNEGLTPPPPPPPLNRVVVEWNSKSTLYTVTWFRRYS